ncbi:MAG: HMA2 domain-containing protein [bacterium]
MSIQPAYVHSLRGRLRIKVAEVKGDLLRAREIEHKLSGFEGIKHLKANPTTGSVLILYDPHQWEQGKIIKTFKELGYLKELCQKQGPDVKPYKSAFAAEAFEGIGQRVMKSLAQTLIESAIQGLVSSLI